MLASPNFKKAAAHFTAAAQALFLEKEKNRIQKQAIHESGKPVHHAALKPVQYLDKHDFTCQNHPHA